MGSGPGFRRDQVRHWNMAERVGSQEMGERMVAENG